MYMLEQPTTTSSGYCSNNAIRTNHNGFWRTSICIADFVQRLSKKDSCRATWNRAICDVSFTVRSFKNAVYSNGRLFRLFRPLFTIFGRIHDAPRARLPLLSQDKLTATRDFAVVDVTALFRVAFLENVANAIHSNGEGQLVAD